MTLALEAASKQAASRVTNAGAAPDGALLVWVKESDILDQPFARPAIAKSDVKLLNTRPGLATRHARVL